ncbi:MAG: PAS domain-containing protein [Casimicrobiaceae bacterium]
MNMKLRESAEQRIVEGTAPVTRGWPTGIQALTLLHGLASAPQTAGDALKLLHELQVHQVELDLQHEHAEQERRQLAQDLTDCTALFDLAPFAYLTLYPNGTVIAANRLAADWLAPAPGDGEDCAGRRIEDVLAPGCRAAVRAMLAALGKGKDRQTCAVQSMAGGANAHAVATAMPGGGQVLMAFVPEGPVSTHRSDRQAGT